MYNVAMEKTQLPLPLSFIPGELLVIKNGQIIYSSKRENWLQQVIIEKRSFVSFKVKKTKIEDSDSTKHLDK